MTERDEHEPKTSSTNRRGPLAWMAQNPIASNLAMAALIFGGLMMMPSIKREVFPEFDLDMVVVNVPYPGASPEEVEQGVLLAVEEAVRGLDGVKEVRSTAREGAGVVTVELLLGTDRNRALSDVKSAVDRISFFPQDAERPIVSLATARRGVVSLILYGDATEHTLRTLAEQTRDGLLRSPGITVVELYSERPMEISIEVPQATLRRYGLTLEQVADAVRKASVELPAGGVKTGKGEVLVRVAERRDVGLEFADIAVLSRPDGTQVLLRDIAEIKDTFADNDQEKLFNGKPAARLQVYRVGDEGPIGVSAAVHKYIEDHQGSLPDGIQMAIWDDRSEMFADRMDLLRRNSIMGLILVIAVLGIFLEIRLAFWVTMGIPISFIGSLLFLPGLDVSVNMVSLFAFIVTLGMVVDDAIVVGEAVYKHKREGHGLTDAAIAGVREVAIPVTFSILTTVIAFLPLLFVPGPAGKFFRNIPLVVIAVLAISLVESVFVLPAHLAEKKHMLTNLLSAPFRAIDAVSAKLFRVRPTESVHRQQQRFSGALEWFVQHIYGGALRVCMRWRYLSSAVGFSMLVLTIGVVAGGRAKFTFLPKIDGDVVAARVEMPFGTPVEVTRRYQHRILEAAQQLLDEHGGADKLSRGIFSEVGGPGFQSAASTSAEGGQGGHVADVMLFMVPSDQRDMTSSEFAKLWRERVGDIPGAESVSYQFSTGQSSAPIQVRLSHPDPVTLEAAAERLAAKIRDYSGTYDVKDGTRQGKEQLDLKLRPEARSLGLDQVSLARQVRSAFFGAEALRQQRGRDEVRVFVRRPKAERTSESDIEDLIARTPDGGEIPLLQAAQVVRGRAYTTIERTNGGRTIDVISDLDESTGANASEIQADLTNNFLPQLMAETPQLTYSLEGQGRDRAEMMGGLGKGFLAAIVAMWALLAMAFRSYLQPFLVLLAIPFGIIGAVGGHLLMGYALSLMTMFGLVALSGVVVNDSLVLVDAINRYRAMGMPLSEAVSAGAERRFRPILLTSLTTFFGLAPMISETSTQARFLIPMAISLGFGVLFSTFVILILVPCAYLILDDLKRLFSGLWHREETTPVPSAKLEAEYTA